jgi:hypothetical protein
VARETGCSRIIAFEPDARSFDQLCANALLTGLSRRIEARPASCYFFMPRTRQP